MNSPDFKINPDLPIAAHADEIRRVWSMHPLIIVAGPPGCGKTTQLPKIALSLGRGVERRIGCTQPRRLAAMAAARRLAMELNHPLGGLVGFQHRYGRLVGPETRVKYMTDGILLAEMRRQHRFESYDTLMIDEAHERSLNIDFLLGAIRRVLPKRKRDLRVIISSATLETERFSAFFDDAPILRIGGEPHPVDLRYLPPETEDGDLPTQVMSAVRHVLENNPPGDILVFLAGEHDIRECAETLRTSITHDIRILPLMATLTAAEQQRVFEPAPCTRVILSTNIAETSLTLPGIRYVIDSGLARINRFHSRTQIQRLHIEPVSQASARQRAGRCGRLGPGVCIRLYSEEDLARRPPHTDPEIRRTSLAGVILRMADQGLGSLERFPFLDPPSPTAIRDGHRELFELGALDEHRGITPLGRRMAPFPIEPRLARMLFEAHALGVLGDVLIVVAAMASDDPRRRPILQRQEADAAHAQFAAPRSDFAGRIRLWRAFHAQSDAGSRSSLRRWCIQQFLSFSRMRQWQDLHRQLDQLCRQCNLPPKPSSGNDAHVHQALLTGLLGRVGCHAPESREYQGANGIRMILHPASALAGHPPPWIMAGAIVDTSRRFAREAAAIDPEWILKSAAHLLKRSWHSPYWDAHTGFVRARERATLYGLLIRDGIPRDYGALDPAAARPVFIHHALVMGEMKTPPPFLRHNLDTAQTLRDNAQKTRIGINDLEDQQFAFYAEHLPHHIVNAHTLRKWAASLTPEAERTLRFQVSTLIPDAQHPAGMPDFIDVGGYRLQLRYRHAPGTADDGITCLIPSSSLAALRAWRHDWLVPGALPKKVRVLLSALPNRMQRRLAPLEETVSACLRRMKPGSLPLADALAHAIDEEKGLHVDPDIWREDRLPDAVRINFRVQDEPGRILAESRHLDDLRRRFGDSVPGTDADGNRPAAGSPDRWTDWNFGDLPDHVAEGGAGWQTRSFPALVDGHTHVTLCRFADAAEAAIAHEHGTFRLLWLALRRHAPLPNRSGGIPRQTLQAYAALGGTPDTLAEEIRIAAIRRIAIEDQPPVRTHAEFQHHLNRGKTMLTESVRDITRQIGAILSAAEECRRALNGPVPPIAADDIAEQLAWLVFPGFVEIIPTARRAHYPRYLDALRVRIERLAYNSDGDGRRLAKLRPYWQRYTRLEAEDPPPPHDRMALQRYRWAIEEWRVSLFAQELGAAERISEQRLERLWHSVMTP